jgi:hypothetical protein
MSRRNPSPKLAITIDPALYRKSLRRRREALLRRTGLAAVALWEKQHGRLTAEEMTEAHRNVRAQIRTPAGA